MVSRLRKSQENLAGASPAEAEILGSRSALDGLNRSKSYGSLAGAGLAASNGTNSYNPFPLFSPHS